MDACLRRRPSAAPSLAKTLTFDNQRSIPSPRLSTTPKPGASGQLCSIKTDSFDFD